MTEQPNTGDIFVMMIQDEPMDGHAESECTALRAEVERLRDGNALLGRVQTEYTKRLEAWDVDRKQLLATHAALVAQLEAAERAKDTAFAGNARATEEARQLRERLSVEEGGRSRSESLLQKTAWRLEALHVAAHAACGMWERTPSASIHDIRTSMRSLREVLNKPNLRSNPDAALVTQVAELTRERDEARTTLADIEASHRAADDRWQAAERTVIQLNDMNDRAFAEVTRLAEALAAAELSAREHADESQRRGYACRRAVERAESAEAQVAKLTRERDEARVEADEHYSTCLTQADWLSSERREVTRLTRERDEARALLELSRERRAEAEKHAAESRLAAANALLLRARAMAQAETLQDDIDTHLAAQPATAPARAVESKQ